MMNGRSILVFICYKVLEMEDGSLLVSTTLYLYIFLFLISKKINDDYNRRLKRLKKNNGFTCFSEYYWYMKKISTSLQYEYSRQRIDNLLNTYYECMMLKSQSCA
jgi:hypothetical protein